jgi:hypothetical protein
MTKKKKKCVYFRDTTEYDAILGVDCHIRCACSDERAHCKDQMPRARLSSFSSTKRLATLCPHRVLVPVPVKVPARTIPYRISRPMFKPVKLCLFCCYFWSGRWHHSPNHLYNFEMGCCGPHGTEWKLTATELQQGGGVQLRCAMVKAVKCPHYTVVDGSTGVIARFLRGEGGYE